MVPGGKGGRASLECDAEPCITAFDGPADELFVSL